MCIAEVFKEWGGHLFSILGIVGGLILYFRHDRKLKMQERLLNELQIKQYQKTEDEEKKARLECCVIKGDKGRRSIRFSNVGLADARNVRIEILNENDLKGVYIRGQLGPYDLITSRSGFREEMISLDAGHTKALNLRITWDDDFKEGRSINQAPQL